jgi:MFS family permease
MTSAPPSRAGSAPAQDDSSLAPLRYPVYAVLWLATVVSNVGTWMQNATAGWLMTTLDPDPFLVSMVQVSTSLPLFIFAIPAGALADIVDRRRLLIVSQTAIVVIVAALGTLVYQQRVTPLTLLMFSFAAAAAAALVMPAWQAIVPQLVPRRHLQPAVALNGVGVNVSRAIGPALSGIIIAAWGTASPFWINAATTLGVIAALIWWHPPAAAGWALPPETFVRAIRVGLRHARYNPDLRAAMIRSAGFFLFASAYWALLPLVARDQVSGGPTLYGVLLGAIGAGAVGGAFAVPALRRRFGVDGVVVAATAGTAVAMLLFAVAREPVAALAASVLAGVSWIAALATLNVSAQMALPGWVRGRGLSVYLTVMFGSLTAGSALWGKVAAHAGLPLAHAIAAVGALAALALTRRWKLKPGAADDLGPATQWPVPIARENVDGDQGPALVTVRYRVRPEDRDAFLRAIRQLSFERRRDGAFDWDVFEDLSQPGTFLETFMLDSWTEHLRQHERVTGTDRALQAEVNRFQIEGSPEVSHFLSRGEAAPS